MAADNLIVSVCVLTYQHAPYIRECLDSILMQKTDFPFEIVLGEDGSTDGTGEICKEYAEKYPGIIRLLLNSRENVVYIKGRPTGRWNLVNTLKNARGKYIALLEGDDYWTDPLKLQKQVNILETHDDIIACHHWHVYKYENGLKDKGTSKRGYCKKTITTARDIFANRVRIKFRTIMFRNIIDEGFFPDWFMTVAFGDVPLSFLLGKYGNFYFIDEPMAVYRITGKGVSMTGNPIKKKASKFREECLKWIEIWEHANKHYNYKYGKEAMATIAFFYVKIIVKYISMIPKTFLSVIRKEIFI